MNRSTGVPIKLACECIMQMNFILQAVQNRWDSVIKAKCLFKHIFITSWKGDANY